VRKSHALDGAASATATRNNFFHTWFQVFARTSPISKRAIDILVGNKRKFDTTTNHDLFATYVGSHAAADDTDLNNVSHQLHSVIAPPISI